MPTKRENAALIQEKLGIVIDPEASDPKAAVLQTWADRLATDPEGVRLEILTAQLEAALDLDLGSVNLPASQLQTWLSEAASDPAATRVTVLQALEIIPPPPAPLTLKVQVNTTIAAYGGTYADPDQDEGQRVVGAEPMQVKPTARIAAGLRTGTLVEG
ncbi:hypothetical protein [Deinococcus apachensis]|uniref:hypothetical protein n=1 Tax=Deinococcus apachensis TaxID=309886 RepID=UPI0003680A1B|nr:hypothetical protein [Deinococcus apachensis]